MTTTLLLALFTGCAPKAPPPPMAREGYDVSRAALRGPDLFDRFEVPAETPPLSAAELDPEEQLLVVERGGQRRALLVRQMTYHHVAQGTLAGEPWLVAF